MEGTLGSWCGRTFLFLLVCAGSALSAAAGDPQSNYHADVAEVRLTFFATEQNHRAVATLNENDFAVVDQDLVVRDFKSFGRASWTSLDIAVVLDCSESVAGQFKKEIANTLQLIKQSVIPERSFSVISFHGMGPTLICTGNCRTLFTADLLPAVTSGSTPLYDSVVFAADVIARRAEPHSKKVIVLFSDGEDTISRNALSDAIQAAAAQDIQIYGVDVNPSGHSADGAYFLQKLASVSGGQYFRLPQGADALLDAVLEDFHASYTVTYRVPSRSNGYHSIRILPTHNLNLHFRCRDGYEYSRSSE